MSSALNRTLCVTCNKEKITYSCQGCSKRFCLDDLTKHRRNLNQQLEQIQNDHDGLRQNLDDLTSNPLQYFLIEQIEQWEKESIDKIKQTAQQYKDQWINYSKDFLRVINQKLHELAERIKEMQRENEFNEIDLNSLRQKFERLQKQLYQPTAISIGQESTSFIHQLHLVLSSRPADTVEEPFAITIAGGNGQGNRLDQLSRPLGIYVDEYNQILYIADVDNHRVVEWNSNTTHSRIVAGGNEQGNRLDQLNCPTDVIVDQQNSSLIIADSRNRRVMRWSRQNSKQGQIIIANIDCYSLKMHHDGSLYISDPERNEIRRWKKGETHTTVVAGGDRYGNQLNYPAFFFVDDHHSLYISDSNNHRIVKWMSDAKEGILVAGGNGKGDRMMQLSYPAQVIVDQFGYIFIADAGNDRIVRWYEGAKEGTIVVGSNGRGKQTNQLDNPVALCLGLQRNLYVVDRSNHRIQKFEIDYDILR